MLSQRPIGLPSERQGAAAPCQEQAPPQPIRPPSFTSDPATAALLSSSTTSTPAVGVPPALPGQSSPARPPPISNSEDLPLRIRDAIVAAQWSDKNTDPHAPLGLSPAALLAAGVCDAQRDADAVVKALVGGRVGVLASETHEPVTTRIGARLTHQVRVLPVPAVKLLVMVLFFWEDEVVRLRRYANEQADLEVALGRLRAERARLEEEKSVTGRDGTVGGGDAAQDDDAARVEELREEKERLEKMATEVQFRIRAIELRKKVLPSKRNAETDLPRYEPTASL